jgi:hypothetical protein
MPQPRGYLALTPAHLEERCACRCLPTPDLVRTDVSCDPWMTLSLATGANGDAARVTYTSRVASNFPADASQLTFMREFPTMYRCGLTLWGDQFSSGLVTESAWSDDLLESRLLTVRSAFSRVFVTDPHQLHSAVADRLPSDCDPKEFEKCEVVSLSAFWADGALWPVLHLAYGVSGDGVYVIAEVLDGAVTSVELND